MTRRARITGLGSYLPERVLTNQDLEKIVETSDEWIFFTYWDEGTSFSGRE